MLTSFSDDEALFGAIMAGAAGYLLKQVTDADLTGAVRTVAAGGTLLAPGVAATVLARLRRGGAQDPRYVSVSPQERRILELVTEGLTNREIAGAAASGREDGEELRLVGPAQAGLRPPNRGGRVRHPPATRLTALISPTPQRGTP